MIKEFNPLRAILIFYILASLGSVAGGRRNGSRLLFCVGGDFVRR